MSHRRPLHAPFSRGDRPAASLLSPRCDGRFFFYYKRTFCILSAHAPPAQARGPRGFAGGSAESSRLAGLMRGVLRRIGGLLEVVGVFGENRRGSYGFFVIGNVEFVLSRGLLYFETF